MMRSRGRIRFGVALALLAALPAPAMAAAGAGDRDAPASRYALRDAALEPQGEPSTSGRFRLDADGPA